MIERCEWCGARREASESKCTYCGTKFPIPEPIRIFPKLELELECPEITPVEIEESTYAEVAIALIAILTIVLVLVFKLPPIGTVAFGLGAIIAIFIGDSIGRRRHEA